MKRTNINFALLQLLTCCKWKCISSPRPPIYNWQESLETSISTWMNIPTTSHSSLMHDIICLVSLLISINPSKDIMQDKSISSTYKPPRPRHRFGPQASRFYWLWTLYRNRVTTFVFSSRPHLTSCSTHWFDWSSHLFYKHFYEYLYMSPAYFWNSISVYKFKLISLHHSNF